jgi:hypothetical protein
MVGVNSAAQWKFPLLTAGKFHCSVRPKSYDLTTCILDLCCGRDAALSGRKCDFLLLLEF